MAVSIARSVRRPARLYPDRRGLRESGHARPPRRVAAPPGHRRWHRATAGPAALRDAALGARGRRARPPDSSPVDRDLCPFSPTASTAARASCGTGSGWTTCMAAPLVYRRRCSVPSSPGWSSTRSTWARATPRPRTRWSLTPTRERRGSRRSRSPTASSASNRSTWRRRRDAHQRWQPEWRHVPPGTPLGAVQRQAAHRRAVPMPGVPGALGHTSAPAPLAVSLGSGRACHPKGGGRKGTPRACERGGSPRGRSP